MNGHSKQLVVLVGGRGTRLGDAARTTPKPLMQIESGKVFLDYFLEGAIRQGFSDVLMLAGHLGEQVRERYDHRTIHGAYVDVLIEPEPLGTGGAFAFARDRLAPTFVAANGDTLFDCNLRALDRDLQSDPRRMGVIALRQVNNAGRYGSVDVDHHGRITRFREKTADSDSMSGLISGGIYALRREAIERLMHLPASIESDLFPLLADEGTLAGRESRGYFLDIGLPETLAIAREDLPRRRRKAVFLDRDGVLNIEKNYVHRLDQWEWVDGAIEAIREFNNRGYAVIVVTNQAGVGHGYYNESAIWVLHDTIQAELNAHGAYIDAFYYCPFHEKAIVPRYRVANHPNRKPNGGMLLKAARQINIDMASSFLIGDRQTDLDAASAAGIRGYLFPGGNLLTFVRSLPLMDV